MMSSRRILLLAIGVAGLTLSGCNTTYPGSLGFATWEFQRSHIKPAYEIDAVCGGVVIKDKYQVDTRR